MSLYAANVSVYSPWGGFWLRPLVLTCRPLTVSAAADRCAQKRQHHHNLSLPLFIKQYSLFRNYMYSKLWRRQRRHWWSPVAWRRLLRRRHTAVFPSPSVSTSSPQILRSCLSRRSVKWRRAKPRRRLHVCIIDLPLFGVCARRRVNGACACSQRSAQLPDTLASMRPPGFACLLWVVMALPSHPPCDPVLFYRACRDQKRENGKDGHWIVEQRSHCWIPPFFSNILIVTQEEWRGQKAMKEAMGVWRKDEETVFASFSRLFILSYAQ